MPKKTSTAAGSLGDGMAVKVPVSVMTVWAEAVAKAAARKSVAKAGRAWRLRAALLNMEILLIRIRAGKRCQRGRRRGQIVAARN
jgi:hypothetical protein